MKIEEKTTETVLDSRFTRRLDKITKNGLEPLKTYGAGSPIEV